MTNAVVALLAIFCHVSSAAVAPTDADFFRAHTPLPRAQYTASGFEGRSHMFNGHLAATDGLETRACEDFSIEAMMSLKQLLLASAHPELNSVYERAGDRRRLSHSVGAAAPLVVEDEALGNVVRDSMCIEAVNLYTHHLAEAQKLEFHVLSALPLMPVSEHKENPERRRLKEQRVVFDRYLQVTEANMCHDEVSEPLIRNPDAPVFPEVFLVVLDQEGFGLRDEDGIPNLDADTVVDTLVRYYNWPLRAMRMDLVHADGSIELHLNRGNLAFRIIDGVCTLDTQGGDGRNFGVFVPNWLQLGDVIRLPDVVVNGLDCTGWDRLEPTSGSSHQIFWSKTEDRVVQAYNEGGRYSYVVDNFLPMRPFHPHAMDPDTYAIPDVCLGLDFANPVSSSIGAAEGSSMETAGIVGMAVAGTVFAVAGVATARRFRETQGRAAHFSQLADPVLGRGTDAKHYEMGDSNSNRCLSGGTASV
jgi:hypothetical protein